MLLKYSLHEPRRGRDDIKAFMTDFREAFPDLNFWGTADLIAEGDYVVGQWEGGGTHTGPAFNDFLVGALPAATGRKMRFTGTTVLRIERQDRRGDRSRRRRDGADPTRADQGRLTRRPSIVSATGPLGSRRLARPLVRAASASLARLRVGRNVRSWRGIRIAHEEPGRGHRGAKHHCVRDTTVVTVDPQRQRPLRRGGRGTGRQDRRRSVHRARSWRAFPAPRSVDGAGKVVMPGFANIHTHFTLIIAKGIYEDLSPPHKPPFTSGLAPLPVPELSTRRDGRDGAARRPGGDPQRHDGGAGRRQQYRELRAERSPIPGLRLLLCERAWDKAKGSIGDPGPFDVDAALGERCIARIEALHASGTARATAASRSASAAWAPDMCSPDLLRRLRALQDRLDTRRDHPPEPDLGRGLGGREASATASRPNISPISGS